jgi:hypothetical protein
MPDATVMQRPEPPYELTDEQADEWRQLVARMPADWFPRETHGLLAQYCRHIVAARRIGQLVHQIEKKKKLDVAEYDQLLKMQEREGRALSSLATRMRLTQQLAISNYKKPGKSRTVTPPWEAIDGDA